jgi:hypothetical protein
LQIVDDNQARGRQREGFGRMSHPTSNPVATTASSTKGDLEPFGDPGPGALPPAARRSIILLSQRRAFAMSTTHGGSASQVLE